MTDIFVFGSNLAGRHGKGSAKVALNWGAEYGKGSGRQGNSYAIPTKDSSLRTLDLFTIKGYVDEFIQYANDHPDCHFICVAIGCGLAGYTPNLMAPLFKGVPANVSLPRDFQQVLHGA